MGELGQSEPETSSETRKEQDPPPPPETAEPIMASPASPGKTGREETLPLNDLEDPLRRLAESVQRDDPQHLTANLGRYVQFDSSSATLEPAAKTVLSQIAALLKDSDNLEHQGHRAHGQFRQQLVQSVLIRQARQGRCGLPCRARCSSRSLDTRGAGKERNES